jgi:hypothetical protein
MRALTRVIGSARVVLPNSAWSGLRAVICYSCFTRCERRATAEPQGRWAPAGEDMNNENIRHFLLWCTVIDYGVLLVWFLVFVFAHEAMHKVHSRWFQLSRDQFDALHYAGMSVFKIGIILFNLVPCVVLYIVG